jgi:hypothetical protein
MRSAVVMEEDDAFLIRQNTLAFEVELHSIAATVGSRHWC